MKPYAILGMRNRTMMDSYGILDSYRQKISGTDGQIEKSIEIGAGGFVTKTCFEVRDRQRLKSLAEEEVRGGAYTKSFFDSIDSSYENVVSDIRTFAFDDFSLLENEDLIRLFDRVYRIYLTTFHPMVLAIYASDLQELFERELRTVTGKESVTQDESIGYMALLLTPDRLSTIQKEEQLMYELQDLFETCDGPNDYGNFVRWCDEPPIRDRLSALADEYGWFHAEFIGEPRGIKDYERQLWERIQNLKNESGDWKSQVSPIQRLEGIIRDQKIFFESHPRAVFLKELSFAMQEFQIVLDYSKAKLVQGLFLGRKLFDEIARRIGMDSWIDARYLLPEELKSLLSERKRVESERIRARKECFAFKLENGTISVFFGNDAKDVIDRSVQIEKVDDVTEIKGVTAYSGKVKGVACVVTSAADREKFQRGNILVTRDTTTELTSIIKMAKAIVADHGSLLSHVSIVSREFKIPCIILTKIGTQVIEDGTLLEVDASNGKVRILK